MGKIVLSDIALNNSIVKNNNTKVSNKHIIEDDKLNKEYKKREIRHRRGEIDTLIKTRNYITNSKDTNYKTLVK